LKAKEPRDRSASVRARLLNLARDRGEDFQITLRNYLFERFLYRLSRSELRERFVLKGAMLLRLWADQPYRATVDLDLLSRGNPDPDSVARDIAAICRTGVPDDAVVFDASTITVEPTQLRAGGSMGVSTSKVLPGSVLFVGGCIARPRRCRHWTTEVARLHSSSSRPAGCDGRGGREPRFGKAIQANWAGR